MMRFVRMFSCVTLWVSLLTASSLAQSDGDVAIELSGFSVSEAYDLNAGFPLDLSDPQLMKLLFRSGNISAVNFKKWSRFADDVSWEQLSAAPQRFRFWTFNRNLTLKHLSQIRFPKTLASEEIKGVYLAKCVNDAGQEVYLVTRSAPRKLTLQQTLDQPVSFSGFFYNDVAVGPTGELEISSEVDDADESADGDQAEEEPASETVPLFVANRFSWYPTAVDDSMGISTGQVDLASLGVDVGLFDYVRKQNSKALSAEDSDAFYQMLAAARSVGSSAEAEEPSSSSPAISFIELMSAPTRHFGNTIQLSGRLRQCVPIQITDEARQSLVGLDRYFQVSLFPDLKGRDVVVRTSGDESIKFKQFPVTVCLPQLPQGFTADQLEGKKVQVTGNFYRFIKYQSKVASDAGQSGQVSPLVMASHMKVISATVTTAGVDLLMRVLLIVLVAGVATAVAYGLFRDRKKRSRLVAGEGDVLPEKIDLSEFEHQIDD